MKEKIVVLDFESKNLHSITKKFRKFGYYTEIAIQNTDLSELENVKGFVFACQNDLEANINFSENYLNIDSINLPVLKINDTEIEEQEMRKTLEQMLATLPSSILRREMLEKIEHTEPFCGYPDIIRSLKAKEEQ